MEATRDALLDDAALLRGCLSDLVSVMALPALWAGGEPPQIVRTLLDALLGMLRPVFVLVRLGDPQAGTSADTMRLSDPSDDSAGAREIGEAVDSALGNAPRSWPARARMMVGRLDVSVASARMGLSGEIGGVVVGSRRHDFPLRTETLLLDVAANQAAIGLQQARLLGEQRRVSRELDERVARRTRELEKASGALRELRMEISRAAQVATGAELAASIAHEVNQPLSGIITNASTCLRMLAAEPPNVDGARETARRTIRDGNRASEVIARLRALFGKKDFTLESLDLNEATREIIALSASDLQANRVVLRLDFADDLPPVTGDRLQIQQVILNLLHNASDAMAGVDDRPRLLLVRTQREDGDRVRVTVRDSGVGVDRESAEKLFDAFYTTKSGGMGIGLSVSRSIVERHRGRLWLEPNDGPGATFAFSVPCRPAGVGDGDAPPT